MVSKKILISGLMIASLSLTGCSAIQDMLQSKVNDLNKGIADTAKQVSTEVNAKIGETGEALKKEGEKIEVDIKAAAEALKEVVYLEDATFGLKFVGTGTGCTGNYAVKKESTSNSITLAQYGVYVLKSANWDKNSAWYYYEVIKNGNPPKETLDSYKKVLDLEKGNALFMISPQDGPSEKQTCELSVKKV